MSSLNDQDAHSTRARGHKKQEGSLKGSMSVLGSSFGSRGLARDGDVSHWCNYATDPEGQYNTNWLDITANEILQEDEAGIVQSVKGSMGMEEAVEVGLRI
jgi:hypothetical protein